MMTLEKMQQQIARGYLESPDDIRAILAHTLKRRADEITFIKGDWLGTVFGTVEDEYKETPAKEDTAEVLDVLVMTDWMSMHCCEFEFTKSLRNELLSIARLDPWFELFLDISVNALGKYLLPKAGYSVCNELAKNYSTVNSRFLTDDITVGGLLNGLKGTIDKSWEPDKDIAEYQNQIVGCCRLVQSLVHMICSGFVDVDKRASATDFPYKFLKDALQEEMRYAKQAERSAERLDG